MKTKLLVLVFGITSTITLVAQPTESNWPPDGATWVYGDWGLGVGELFLKLTYTGDTLFNEQIVNKLQRTVISHTYLSPGNIDTSFQNDGFEYLYEKNDSVFRWQNGSFNLLYIFNAPVGSDWQIIGDEHIDYLCDSTFTFDTLKVIENKEYIVSGNTISAIAVESQLNRWSYYIPSFALIMDQIGSLGSPFPLSIVADTCESALIDFPPFFPATLKCYSDNETGYLDFGHFGDCHDLTTSNINPITSFPNFYPNPTTGLLHFSTNFHHVDFQLFDIVGKTYDVTITNDKTLNLHHLPTGIYILSINDKNGNRSFHRILKK